MPGNWNKDDPNNPLLQLLKGRGMYGRAGSQVYDADPSGGASWMKEAAGRMPQYYSQSTAPGSEGGGGDTLTGLSPLAKKSLRRNGETWTQLASLDVGNGANNVIDPSKVEYDEEMGLITPASNIKRDTNAEGGDLALFIAGSAALGGATAGAAMGGAEGAAAGGAGEMFGPPASSMNFGLDAIPGLESTTVGGFGPGFEMGAGGSGLGSLGASGDFVGPPASSMNLGTEALPGMSPTSVGNLGPGLSQPGVLDRAAQWAGKNPGTLARGAMGLAALGAGGGSGGGSGGSGGNSDDPGSIIEQMARANRVDQNTPLGSRRWSQDPATGQWTVNDTMDPAEASNFKNVQGMNSSITDMARARLAALLAQPQRPRADRPFGA